jgi:hypothetical protein
MYANDTVGNMNSTRSFFRVEAPVVVPAGGGGSAPYTTTVIIYNNTGAVNATVAVVRLVAVAVPIPGAVGDPNVVTSDDGDDATVCVLSASSWQVGWVEQLLVHKSDELALRMAEALRVAVAQDTVLDEVVLAKYEQRMAAGCD